MAEPLQVNKSLLARMLAGDPALDWASFTSEDWRLIVQRAIAEDVAPQLYFALIKSGGMAYIPRREQKHLRAIYVSTRMKNEQSLCELERLAGLFEQAGIPVVALKGSCYALTVYTDIGLRPMVDVDLLVPASVLEEAMQIVWNSGYREALPEAAPGLNKVLNHAACMSKVQFPFTTIELHHTLVGEEAYQYAVPVDWFWTQIEDLVKGSTRWRLGRLMKLTPTAQLLYACAHAMLQHGSRNTSLCWLYDLDQMVRAYGPRLDWSLFLSQARVFAWGSAAHAALSKVVNFFDTPVPPNVLEALAAQVDHNIDLVMEMQIQPATHTEHEYQTFKTLNGKGKLKLVQGLVTPGPAYMRWRYGMKTSWTLPLWYLYRWWTILSDLIHTGWVLVLKRQPLKRNGTV